LVVVPPGFSLEWSWAAYRSTWRSAWWPLSRARTSPSRRGWPTAAWWWAPRRGSKRTHLLDRVVQPVPLSVVEKRVHLFGHLPQRGPHVFLRLVDDGPIALVRRFQERAERLVAGLKKTLGLLNESARPAVGRSRGTRSPFASSSSRLSPRGA
jgi:hypothetical protein